MKRWSENPLALPFVIVIAVLAFAVTPFTLLWHSLRSKRTSVREGRLLLAKEEIGLEQIEYVLIHAYWPVESFVLKLNGRSRVSIIPEEGSALYAWIKANKPAVRIEGPRKREFSRRLGLP